MITNGYKAYRDNGTVGEVGGERKWEDRTATRMSSPVYYTIVYKMQTTYTRGCIAHDDHGIRGEVGGGAKLGRSDRNLDELARIHMTTDI